MTARDHPDHKWRLFRERRFGTSAFGSSGLSHAVSKLTLAVLFITATTPAALAQTGGGVLYGAVLDPTGTGIQAATITERNIHTGALRTATTDASGNYSFLALEAGDYSVKAEAPGFRSQTQLGIRLDANRNVHVGLTLRVGEAREVETVVASTTLVDTRGSEIGSTVDPGRIEDLPLNGRDAYDLVQTIPGITNYVADVATGSRTGTQLTANGITHNSAFYLGGNILPNPDSLEEFRVLTSAADAEAGHLAGAAIYAVTRSGTTRFHGLAYDYLRNNVFNAKNWFLTSVVPLRQNQFGGNVGGPIRLSGARTFFFSSYQGLRIRQPANITSSSLITPTSLERQGDFTSTPLPLRPNVSCQGVAHIICPNLLDPVAQNLLAFVPLGDATPGPDYGHPPQQSANNNLNADQALVRIDSYQLLKHQISAMYFQSRGTTNNPTIGGNQIVS